MALENRFAEFFQREPQRGKRKKGVSGRGRKEKEVTEGKR